MSTGRAAKQVGSDDAINSQVYDCLIIGAGTSGLACASKLLENPYYSSGAKRLLVLEARQRIGGRIGSVYLHGNRLDTGANWIHGVGTVENPNPLMDILPHKQYKELNSHVMFKAPKWRRSSATGIDTNRSDGVEVTLKPLKENQKPGDTGNDGVEVVSSTPVSDRGWTLIEPRQHLDDTFVMSDQESSSSGTYAGTDPQAEHKFSTQETLDLVIEPQISGAIFGALWNVIGNLHERGSATSEAEGKKISILQAVREDPEFTKSVGTVPDEYHQTLFALPQFVENMEAAPLQRESSTYGATEPGLGLLEFAIDDFEGDQVFLRDGYIAVVEELAKNVVENGLVSLGKDVDLIDWNQEVCVVTTTSGESFRAKKVVCTLPLGVLQHRHAAERAALESPLFRPKLPEGTRQAIESLGYGVLDKIFLVFKDPWWKQPPYSEILKKGLTYHHFSTHGEQQREPEEPDSILGFTSELSGLSVTPEGVQSGPRALSITNLHSLTGYPVLCAFISCSNALHMESLSDAAAASIVHRAFSDWIGVAPPKPDAVYVTRWHQDPYARGSYTHMITGVSETRHREVFGRPLSERLFFAGEHTSRDHFATVHGALISGWHAAEAVLEADDNVRKLTTTR